MSLYGGYFAVRFGLDPRGLDMVVKAWANFKRDHEHRDVMWKVFGGRAHYNNRGHVVGVDGGEWGTMLNHLTKKTLWGAKFKLKGISRDTPDGRRYLDMEDVKEDYEVLSAQFGDQQGHDYWIKSGADILTNDRKPYSGNGYCVQVRGRTVGWVEDEKRSSIRGLLPGSYSTKVPFLPISISTSGVGVSMPGIGIFYPWDHFTPAKYEPTKKGSIVMTLLIAADGQSSASVGPLFKKRDSYLNRWFSDSRFNYLRTSYHQTIDTASTSSGGAWPSDGGILGR